MPEQNLPNLFDTAQEYYSRNPLKISENSPEYLEAAQELEFIIDTAPFISDIEKKRLKTLMALFPFKTLEQLKIELIKEGITYHQTHEGDKKMLRWLKLVVQRSKSVKQ